MATPSRDPKYADELTFNYYILLKNKSALYPQGTLLVGSVTHTSIPQERDMHSVVYISPRTLERFSMEGCRATSNRRSSTSE